MLKIQVQDKDVSVEAWSSFVLLDMSNHQYFRHYQDHGIIAMDVVGADSAVKALRAVLLSGGSVRVKLPEPGNRYASIACIGFGSCSSIIAKQGDIAHMIVINKESFKTVLPVMENETISTALLKKLSVTSTIPLLPEWKDYLVDHISVRKLKVLGECPGVRGFWHVWTNDAAPAISRGLKYKEIQLPKTGQGNGKLAGIENMDDYLKVFASELAEKVTEAHPPLYDPRTMPKHPKIASLLRQPYPAQADTIMGIYEELKTRRTAILRGAMGVGKTLMAATIPYLMKDNYRCVVMCPPHLVEKWVREIKNTVPNAHAETIRNWKDALSLKQIVNTPPTGPQYYVMSRETAKLGAFRKPGVIWRKPIYSKGKSTFKCVREGAWICPSCGSVIKDDEGIPFGHCEFEKPRKRNTKCKHCTEPLWSADNSRTRRIAVVDIIKKLPKGFFDMFIADEVHELKGESAQGQAFGVIASRAKKTIALTGTLLGGYASDLYYLLWRMDPQRMVEDGFEFKSKTLFVNKYGVLERITKESDKDTEYNWSSRGRKSTRVVERPGANPRLFSKHLLETTAFLELQDLHANLPPYTEEVIGIEMSENLGNAYKRLEKQLRNAASQALSRGSKRLLGVVLQNLLSYPDRPWGNPAVIDKETSSVIAKPIELPQTALYPKEKELIRIIEEEVSQGRRVFVYLVYTGTRDVAERVKQVVQTTGYQVEILRSKVKPIEREEWLKERVSQGTQVIIANADLVKTGLDLLEFPTLVFYQTGYSVFTLRQAARRSWRIGQSEPVRVCFLSYKDTMQYNALTLIGSKLQASLALEGQFSEDGLRALAEGTDMTMELAKTLVEGIGNLESAESIWRKAYAPQMIPANTLTPTRRVIPFSELAKQAPRREKRVPDAQLALFAN